MHTLVFRKIYLRSHNKIIRTLKFIHVHQKLQITNPENNHLKKVKLKNSRNEVFLQSK
jgi:hypothetical protein